MTRILGIDPGSRITGYGVIEFKGNRIKKLTSGSIKVSANSFPFRIKEIYDRVLSIAEEYVPVDLAIEKVFVQRNVDSALKLGQARGAAMCAAMSYVEEVYEYAPNQIKQAVVGHGHADKAQVQHMVKIILSLDELPQSDEADALACAICHRHMKKTLDRIKESESKNV